MSAFKNGDIVKTKTDVYGRVQAYRPELHPITPKEKFQIPEESAHLEYREQLPTKNPGKSGPPGSEIDEPVRIPKGKIGEVLYSDDIDTIVMFSINETGRLQPAIVKAQGFTKDFERMLRDPEKHPFIETSNPPRSLKNPQKALEEPEKEIMGEIIDVSPTIKPFSKWKRVSKWKISAQIPPGSDPFEWEGGKGPHAQLLEAQDIDFINLPFEKQKEAVINALRVGILSPMKDLSHNAMHYQDISHIPPDETDVNVYEEALLGSRERWNEENRLYKQKRPKGLRQEYEHGMLLGDREHEESHKQHMYWQRYPGWIKSHLQSIADLSKHADDLTKVAIRDVQETGGKGTLWKQALRNINVPGVNNKVASFAWLLLHPKTSELATIDRHMMNFLGMKGMPDNDVKYDAYESQLKDIKDQYPEYDNMPLGAFQWGAWDYIRTGPGSHQLHEPLKPIGFEPYWETEWHKRVKKPKERKPKTGPTPMEDQIGFDFESKWKRSDINDPPHPPNTSGPSMSMSEDLAHRFEWRQFEKKRRRAEKEHKKQMNKKFHPNHNFFYNQGWMYMPHIFDMKNAPPQKKIHRMKQEDLDYWTQAHNTPIENLKEERERIQGYSLSEDSPIVAGLPRIDRAIGWHEEKVKPFLEESQRRQQGQGMNRNLFNTKRKSGKWRVK